MKLTFNFRIRAVALVLLASLLLPAASPVRTGATEGAEPEEATTDLARRAVHLLEYISVDYPGAVADGRIVNQAEFEEQIAFLTDIDGQLARAGIASDDALRTRVEGLRADVTALAASERITTEAHHLAAAVRERFELETLPRHVPSVERGRALYASACAACHGADGRGTGPMASTLDPPPSDLTDADRMLALPLTAAYSTITFGIAGTAMPAFAPVLSDSERYDLAFFAGSLAFDPATVETGRRLLDDEPALVARYVTGLAELVEEPAADLAIDDRGRAVVAYLRTHPHEVVGTRVSLELARALLARSWQAHQRGDVDEAADLAVASYLDGVERFEPALDAVSSSLRGEVEQSFLRYREQLRTGASPAALEPFYRAVLERLDAAEARLAGGPLAPATLVLAALTIVAREGFEAVLIVIALAGLLSRAGRRDALPYVHGGWVAALVAGGATWLAARGLIGLAGADRELVEGVSSLVATAILFYVSYWLIAQASSQHWQSYLRERMETALTRGTLFALTAIVFVAVYREIFETILFFEALLAHAGPGGARPIVAGAVSGFVVLGVLAVVVFYLGLRLPMRRFFAGTSLLLYALAVMLAGQGVAALQEGGYLPVHTVRFVRIEALGIYPTLEGLVLQGVLLAAALAAGLWALLEARRARLARSTTEAGNARATR